MKKIESKETLSHPEVFFPHPYGERHKPISQLRNSACLPCRQTTCPSTASLATTRVPAWVRKENLCTKKHFFQFNPFIQSVLPSEQRRSFASLFFFVACKRPSLGASPARLLAARENRLREEFSAAKGAELNGGVEEISFGVLAGDAPKDGYIQDKKENETRR